ncbi:MAG: zinc ABC transporter substrate-binding protein [Bacteroidales bacterium]|nr:zinc ABC transporter substrate-binding protein [Bacteroidales bacterium]
MNFHRLILVPVVLLGLVSCGEKSTNNGTDKPLVTVSVAPQAWFVDQISGGLVSARPMVPRAANPEEYDPSPLDIARLEESALFIYTGTLPFEIAWIDRLSGTETKVLNLAERMPHDLLFPVEETHGDGHTHPLGDPHFWTSFEGGRQIAEVSFEALVGLLPGDSTVLRKNYEALLAKISDLEDESRETYASDASPKAFLIYHPSLTAYSREMGLRQLVIEEDGKEPSPRHLASVLHEAAAAGVKTVLVQKEFNPSGSRSAAKELSIKTVEINPYDYDWEGQMRLLVSALTETPLRK